MSHSVTEWTVSERNTKLKSLRQVPHHQTSPDFVSRRATHTRLIWRKVASNGVVEAWSHNHNTCCAQPLAFRNTFRRLAFEEYWSFSRRSFAIGTSWHEIFLHASLASYRLRESSTFAHILSCRAMRKSRWRVNNVGKNDCQIWKKTGSKLVQLQLKCWTNHWQSGELLVWTLERLSAKVSCFFLPISGPGSEWQTSSVSKNGLGMLRDPQCSCLHGTAAAACSIGHSLSAEARGLTPPLTDSFLDSCRCSTCWTLLVCKNQQQQDSFTISLNASSNFTSISRRHVRVEWHVRTINKLTTTTTTN